MLCTSFGLLDWAMCIEKRERRRWEATEEEDGDEERDSRT